MTVPIRNRLSPYVVIFAVLACAEAIMALLWIATLGLSSDVYPTVGYSAIFAALTAVAYVRGVPFGGTSLNGWLRARAHYISLLAAVIIPVAAAIGIAAIGVYGTLLAIVAAGLSIRHGAQ
ncbi:putative membrane protein [Deinococcus soli (ex Cha et al. 2016)]|uniref:Membrane protein n=1 Tax=Deinococcus soli (ex Cha et al. 2016) TaxID=1309411 RepID=A0AAE4BPN6_9DEIO|nr:hypothetical protein [Deinococcus soli (ex Cha et al. 2016)]MDR6219951.1 putative membrane protein [Deinococcus soli (ex Cha et al. 2016)]